MGQMKPTLDKKISVYLREIGSVSHVIHFVFRVWNIYGLNTYFGAYLQLDNVARGLECRV